MLGPIVYWDLVRFVRRHAHFQQRAGLAAAVGLVVCVANFNTDFRSVGALARVSEEIANLSFALQALAVYLLVPAILAGSICDDRANGRLDLLLATPLSRRRIVADKLLVGVGISLLTMLTLLPYTLLGPIMGGVEPNAVLRAELAAAVETLFVAAVTLLISARSVNDSEALVKSYGLLFTLRYAVPHLPRLVEAVAPASSPSNDAWGWVMGFTPASAAHAAWSPAAPDGPSFAVLLLIPLVIAALALEAAVYNIDRRPALNVRPSRRVSVNSDEALLDAAPLIWRAVHLRVYDRNGVWRWTVWILGSVFAVLVWIGSENVAMSLWATFAILGVVLTINAVVPAQWLINERRSGWLGELQLTPLTVDDVLSAAAVGTTHHLRPLWIVATAASLLLAGCAFVRSPLAGLLLLGTQCLLLSPIWAAFWGSVRQGFAAETTAKAATKVLGGAIARGLLGSWIAGVVMVTLGPVFLWNEILGLLLLAGAFMPYALIYWLGKDHDLREARTALFVMEQTGNFGRKAGDAAWEDWLDAAKGRNLDYKESRLFDVYRAPLPKMHRPTRRR